MNKLINITDLEYGAHQDREDNRAAIQKALDQAGDIYVPEGVFNVSGYLSLKSATRLFGEGTIKLTAKRHEAVLWVRKVEDVSIEGITLDGNFAEKKNDISGVVLISNGSANISLNELNILNAGHFAVSGANANFLQVRSCRISKFKGRGINFTFCNDTHIEANHIDGNVKDQLRGEHGIEIWGKYNDVRDSKRHVVSNNFVKNVGGGGIWTATVDDIVIIGNHAENCGDVCLDVEDSRNARIVGNVARNGKNAAIASFYASDGVWIQANQVIQEKGFGPAVRIFGKGISKNITISHNTLETVDSTVIATDQGALGDSDIYKNYIKSSKGMGMRMLEADDIRISGNMILMGQSHTGIAIEGGRKCQLHGNHIRKYTTENSVDIYKKSSQGGIFLYKRNDKFDCSANSVTENTIQGFIASINVLCTGQYAEPNYISKNNLSTVFLKGEGSSIVEENSGLQNQQKAVEVTLY
jgi:hypothetical protein